MRKSIDIQTRVTLFAMFLCIVPHQHQEKIQHIQIENKLKLFILYQQFFHSINNHKSKSLNLHFNNMHLTITIPQLYDHAPPARYTYSQIFDS